jgi:Response regulator containing CheY-like receiver, AAA-type ATPase, and DNA-binding domains
MKEHEQYAQVDMTFSQMEGAIESFVETAHLAGLNVDDLLALLDAGLNIKEIIELIGVKGSSPGEVDILRNPWSHARKFSGSCLMRPLVEQKSKKKVILCIDDDVSVLECEREFLTTFGYRVLTAPSGDAGLRLASKNCVDVVIVDYCMPQMNGQEVAIEVRRLRPQATIIMLSGSLAVPQEAVNTVDAFVRKDRLATELLQAIETNFPIDG